MEAALELGRVTDVAAHDIPPTKAAFYEWRNRSLFARYPTKRGRRQVPAPVHRALEALQQTIEDLHEAQKHLDACAQSLANIPMPDRSALYGVIKAAVDEASARFVSLAGLPHVAAVKADIDVIAGALRIKTGLSNGRKVDPRDVLSEGALDLLAIVIIAETVYGSATLGRAPVLMLDDVFQSIDAVYRQRATEYVVDRFRSWQLVITTHDRMWLDTIERTLQRASIGYKSIALGRWSPIAGPVVRDTRADPSERLRRAMDDDEPAKVVAMHAGRFIEEVSNRLSQSTRAAISRSPGDRYTLGDTWPGVAKVLRKTVSDSSVVDAVDQQISLRNVVAAHQNDWADGFSESEARDFAEAVLCLWDAVVCSDCYSVLTSPSLGSRPVLPCTCAAAKEPPVSLV